MRGRRGISIWKRNQNRPLLRLWTPNQMVPPCQNLRLQMTCLFIGEFSGVKFSRGFQGQKSSGFGPKSAGLILACAFSRQFLKKIKQKAPKCARTWGLNTAIQFHARGGVRRICRTAGAVLLRSGQRHPVISSLSLLVAMERAGSTGSRVWTIGNVLRGQSLQEVWVVVARCDGGLNRPVLCPVHNSWVPAVSRRKWTVKKSRRWLSGLCFTGGFGAGASGRVPAGSRAGACAPCGEFWWHKSGRVRASASPGFSGFAQARHRKIGPFTVIA